MNPNTPQRDFEMPSSSPPSFTPSTTLEGAGRSWWTEGNRKFIIAIVTIIAIAAVLIGWMVLQPEGVTFTEVLIGLGGLLIGQGGFNFANLREHRYKAQASPDVINNVAKLSVVLLGILLLAGCSASSQSSYIPLLSSTLKASQTPVELAQAEAVKSASLPGCYAAGALSAALETSSQALESWAAAESSQVLEIPGVSVDVSACVGLEPEGMAPWTLEAAEAGVAQYVEGLAPAAFVVARAVLGTSGLEGCDVAVVGGVLAYLEGALSPVVEELVSPDGVAEVPKFEVRLEGCG